MKLQMNKSFFVFTAISFFVLPAFAQPAQQYNPRQTAQQIYQQCMVTADKNFAQQQQKFCRCASDKISTQVSAQEMASIASQAGAGANQKEIGDTLMNDPRFIQVISFCFSEALGADSAGLTPSAPSTPSGLVGRPFGAGN